MKFLQFMKKFFLRIWVAMATVLVMIGTVLLIAIFYIAKFFHKFNFRDPFHNSRQHPLNSPEAPRG